MHRCLVTTEDLLADTCALDRKAARHLQTVLRVRPGDSIMLFDGHGRTRAVTVSAADRNGLVLTADAPVREQPRPACALTLFACVSKGARMEWAVEKATELGAVRIVPVLSAHTVSRPAEATRWRRIAEEAARQCGAAWLPTITDPLAFDVALALAAQIRPLFVAALTPEARPLRDALSAFSVPPPSAGWFVGPEGDFTPAELASLTAAGAIPVSLGPLILRAETACLYGLSVLSCIWGERCARRSF
ncbi:MAG TPA: 16S rRNA (uracil(1498)-N(3))-methyltransferase [Kiritimatiellia bacterium]|jgi:16S rRNA (uracil1498-N3)-methyltransferase|nr:16S rRNA (uracil(1498)-N(3))-methyltransferase [Kiritimatiellia bacterium]